MVKKIRRRMRLAKEELSPHSGHRKRMRERFLRDGIDSLQDHEVLELLLYLDALELDGKTEKPYFYKSQVEKVKAAHRLLTEDLERHYTIAELSERFSIPATALKECFKSVYGQPVNTYMRSLRMDRAALLLRQEPQASVTEIAGRVGYDSASKFAAAFKDTKGKTPLEYRREGR